VRITGPSDHPDDTVGEVVAVDSNGDIHVSFPQSGVEVHARSDLDRA
jgi:hypothetical protein